MHESPLQIGWHRRIWAGRSWTIHDAFGTCPYLFRGMSSFESPWLDRTLDTKSHYAILPFGIRSVPQRSSTSETNLRSHFESWLTRTKFLRHQGWYMRRADYNHGMRIFTHHVRQPNYTPYNTNDIASYLDRKLLSRDGHESHMFIPVSKNTRP
jgi:hypothetical protein